MKDTILHAAWLVLAAPALLAACAAAPTPPVQAAQPGDVAAPDAAGETADATPEPAVEPRSAGTAVVHTTEGPITVTFFPDLAPRTVAHVAALMKAGCYEGVDVFRLEPGFVMQVAPVANADCHPEAMSAVPAEFSQVEHARLHLSMARWEDPDSGTSSWSIVLGPAPSLDGQYTVFGRVVAGEDTIRKIEAIGSTKGDDGMSRLVRRVSIERVEVTEEPGVADGAPE